MASSPPIFELFSEDPEIIALQAMIKGLRHFSHSKKELTMRHFKLVCCRRVVSQAAQAPGDDRGHRDVLSGRPPTSSGRN
jgi:hypothetical protein